MEMLLLDRDSTTDGPAPVWAGRIGRRPMVVAPKLCHAAARGLVLGGICIKLDELWQAFFKGRSVSMNGV
jgi:hypothetical protein